MKLICSVSSRTILSTHSWSTKGRASLMLSATFLRIPSRPVPRQPCRGELQARTSCFSRATPLTARNVIRFQPRHRARPILQCKAEKGEEDEEVSFFFTKAKFSHRLGDIDRSYWPCCHHSCDCNLTTLYKLQPETISVRSNGRSLSQ